MNTVAAIARKPEMAFSVEAVEVALPGPGEIRVQIAGVGLCHTDLIFRDQFLPYPLPAVLGHEGAGTVESIGKDVTGLAVGDHVVVGFSSCGQCERCDEGLPSYCSEFVPLNYAGQRTDGSTSFSQGDVSLASHFFGQSSFAGLTVVRARNAVKIESPDIPIELLGPLGCGLQTGAGAVLRSMDCQPGTAIAIWGGGPVGMAAVMAAKIRECARIILVEPIASRRQVAMELGATLCLDPSEGGIPEKIRDDTMGGVHYAFDTSGNLSAIDDAVNALRSRGVLGLVGVPKSVEDKISVNIAQQITYGLRTMGIIEGDSDPQTFIPELIRYHREGKFPFDRLVKTFPLAEINRAIEEQAKGDCIKAVLVP